MNTATVDIPKVGTVTIVKSKRAKHLRITIRHDQVVKLTLPRGVSEGRAKQFLHSKIPWITKHLRILRDREGAQKDLQLPEINEMEAKDTLIRRFQEMADIHGLEYAKVSIRNQKTKWGSCSSKNSISLNINLARLPTQIRDYVMLHELVHTRIKNHSKKFWAELDKVVGGDAKTLAKKLKNYRLGQMA
jgi:predicted metal-dependent hydrolase